MKTKPIRIHEKVFLFSFPFCVVTTALSFMSSRLIGYEELCLLAIVVVSYFYIMFFSSLITRKIRNILDAVENIDFDDTNAVISVPSSLGSDEKIIIKSIQSALDKAKEVRNAKRIIKCIHDIQTQIEILKKQSLSIRAYDNKLFRKIDSGLKILSEITVSYLMTTKKRSSTISPIEYLNQIVNHYREKYPKIAFQISVSNHASFIDFDSVYFHRIFSNIIKNNCQVLSETSQNQKTCQINLSEELNFFQIEIIDNGPGIPQSIIDNIFKRKPIKGTNGFGVGLSSVEELTSENNVDFKIHTSEKGSKFIFKFSKSSAPSWCFSLPNIDDYDCIVVLDDKVEFLNQLRSTGYFNDIVYFSDHTKFNIDKFDPLTTLFMIDYHLDESLGTDIIEKFNLYDSALLVSDTPHGLADLCESKDIAFSSKQDLLRMIGHDIRPLKIAVIDDNLEEPENSCHNFVFFRSINNFLDRDDLGFDIVVLDRFLEDGDSVNDNFCQLILNKGYKGPILLQSKSVLPSELIPKGFFDMSTRFSDYDLACIHERFIYEKK